MRSLTFFCGNVPVSVSIAFPPVQFDYNAILYFLKRLSMVIFLKLKIVGIKLALWKTPVDLKPAFAVG